MLRWKIPQQIYHKYMYLWKTFRLQDFPKSRHGGLGSARVGASMGLQDASRAGETWGREDSGPKPHQLSWMQNFAPKIACWCLGEFCFSKVSYLICCVLVWHLEGLRSSWTALVVGTAAQHPWMQEKQSMTPQSCTNTIYAYKTLWNWSCCLANLQCVNLAHLCLTFRPTPILQMFMCAVLNLFPQDSKLHHINLMALKTISSTFNYFHFNLSPNYRSSSPPATTAQPRNSSIHCGGRVWWAHSLRTSVSQICYGMTQFYKTISTFNQKLHDFYNIIAWCYFCT